MDSATEVGEEDKDKISKTIKNCLEIAKYFDTVVENSIITKY